MKLRYLALLQIVVCSVLAGIGYGPGSNWIDYCLGGCTMLAIVWLSGYKLEDK